jgi:hypothetical protein
MPRARLIAALVCVGSACGPPEQAVEPPEGVEHVAVGRRAEGLWLEVSALSLPGEPLRAALPGEGEVIAVGWSAESLRTALGELPDAATLRASPLRGTEGCQRPLPTPTWAVALRGGGQVTLDPATLPLLTAAWAVERCPAVELSASVVCGESLAVCPLRGVVPRGGCAYALDFECELGRVDVSVWPGGACTTTPGCQATRGAEGEVVLDCAASCTAGDAGCQATLGQRPVPCEATLDVERRFDPALTRVRLGASAAQLPLPHVLYELWPSAVGTGQLGTPVVLDDTSPPRLVVPTFAWRERGCTAAATTELAFVSTQTATVVARRSAPDCLSLLARDPRGPGFLGLATDEAVPVVYRFDARGDVVRATRLEALPRLSAEIALVSYPDGLVLLAYVTGTADGGVVVVLDPDTLEVEASLVQRGMVPSQVARIDDWIVVVDDFTDAVVWFDRALSQCVGSTTAHLLLVPIVDLGNVPVLGAAFVREPRQLLLAVNEFAALHRIDDLCVGPPGPGEVCFSPEGRCAGGRRVVTRDAGAEPVRMASWPRLETRGLAVASTVRPGKRTWTFEAALTYYDPRAGRFWPGHTPLGHGIARDLVVAPDGALWVTLPWAGELVRLELP